MSPTLFSKSPLPRPFKCTIPLLLLLAMIVPFYLPLPVLAAETQEYDLQDFTKVSSSANIEMIIIVGESFSVSAKGSAKALERLNLTVRDSKLKAGWKPKQGWNWNNVNGNVTISVTMPNLQAAAASSNSSITASGIKADSFTAKASSNAKVILSGTCKDLDARASSNGVIKAKDLQCATANARASSNGDISVFATQAVDGRASSNGDVFIYGNPTEIAEKTSSNGRVAER